ncbi:MAG: peptide chain release factor N(5)-glutamine methyltransferase [Solirubrobacterales bacterium]
MPDSKITEGAPQGDALSAAIESFAAAGIQMPRLDAEVMLSSITGRDRSNLIASPETTLSPAESRSFATAVRRRLRREPVAYIVGSKGFRYIDLIVDPRVLVPRPESEMLVEFALERKPRTVLEIGTGSGAIGLAVANEIPECEVLATDISADAIAVARANAMNLELDDRVEFIVGSLPDEGDFDLILANLPYVADGEGLAPEIRGWEPDVAVFGGKTGYEVFETVLAELAEGEITTRAIGLEIGHGQGDVICGLVEKAGFTDVTLWPDLAGIGRVVVGESPSPESAD